MDKQEKLTIDQIKESLDQFSIEKTIDELAISIEKELPLVKSKLKKFVNSFNKKFPYKNREDRIRAEALTWALMSGPLILYGLNMNGSAIIELHGILERFVLRESVQLIAIPTKKKIVFKIFERFTLNDLISILYNQDIILKEDVNFVKKLTKIRNGLAHKNPRIVSNIILSGKKISVLDIDAVMEKFDCTPLIINTINLFVKLSKSK